MPRGSAADSVWLVVDIATGVAVVAVRAGWWIGGALARALLPMRDLVTRPPLVPERYRPAQLLGRLAAEGQYRRHAAARAGRHLVQRAVPVATAEILDQLDLTELIRERVDLIGLARYVAVGLRLPRSGLPTSARESTGSLTSETVQHPQIHGTEADQALAEWVDRVFGPRRSANDTPDEPTEPQ
ncbi:MAG TPA: hypothetical protein VHH34_17440 [Pseudonocardiaceae bacterium]|nr:hypothetical protein [Pseudonocardiaceae bacterium]